MNKAFTHIISLYITPLLSRLSIFLLLPSGRLGGGLLLLAINASAQGTLTEGREKFYDRLTDTYLYSVPKACFDDGRVGEYLDAQTATTGRTDFTYLPIVHLKGDFGYEYTEGTVSVVMPDGTTSQTNLKAKLKWRGGTTNKEGKHKRNYSVKFINASGDKQDYKFFGLRKDNHWILDAGQVDYSRIRNRVATDIWNDFATKPYYFDKEPKALTGTRGQFVEVFLNDEYRGIYCMTECIDRSQMKLKKYTDNADGTQTIHGQLWKSKGYGQAAFYGYPDYDNTSEMWGDLSTEYPDIDDVCPTDYSTFYNAAKFISDCEWEDFWPAKDEYFDMPVVVDFFIFCVMLNAIDNSNGKNTYWACYDSKVDKKLTIGVWDLDATVGQYFDPYDPDNKIVSPESSINTHYGSNLLRQFFAFGDVDFFRQVELRYAELRNNVFSADSLKSRYNHYMDMLTQCGAYDRETVRWSRDTDIGEHVLDFEKEKEKINDWIDRRFAFVDKQLLNISGIDAITTVSDTPDAIYDILGRRVTKPGKGIYLKLKNSRIQKFRN